MRLFVAVEMSRAIRETLGGTLAALIRCHAPVKWVRAANLHLTLKFLGDVPDDRVSEVHAILRACMEGMRSFPLHIRGIGAFPNLGRPRVIFADAEDASGQAAELAARLNEGMMRVDVAREERPFRCHVTLGRVKKPGPMHRLADQIAKTREQDFGMMTVREIALIQSRLTPDGPIYARIDGVELDPDPTTNED